MIAYLAVYLLHVVVNPDLVALSIRGSCAVRVSAHGDLVGLHQSYLTVLIKHSERVPFGFEDYTDSLQTRSQ